MALGAVASAGRRCRGPTALLAAWGSAVFTSCSARSSRGATVAKRHVASAPRRTGIRTRQMAKKKLERLWPGIWRMRRRRDFDRLVYERVRLGMMSALAVNSSLSFYRPSGSCLTHDSDGNLSVHARKLEDAGYIVDLRKELRRVGYPRTEFELTGEGRRRALEQLSGPHGGAHPRHSSGLRPRSAGGNGRNAERREDFG